MTFTALCHLYLHLGCVTWTGCHIIRWDWGAQKLMSRYNYNYIKYASASVWWFLFLLLLLSRHNFGGLLFRIIRSFCVYVFLFLLWLVCFSFEATVCLRDNMSFKSNRIHCFGVLLLFSRPFASVLLWKPVTVTASMLTGDGGDDGTDTDTKSTHQTTKMLTFCLQIKDHYFFIVPLVEQMTGNHDTSISTPF